MLPYEFLFTVFVSGTSGSVITAIGALRRGLDMLDVKRNYENYSIFV